MKKTLLILILAALCLAGCQSLGARAPSPSAPAVTLRAQTPGPSGTPSLTPSPDAGPALTPELREYPNPLAIGSVHLYLGSNADCPPTGGKGRFDGRANLEHDALRLPEGRLYSIAKEDTGTYPYLIDLGEEEQREFLARIESSAARKAGEGPFYSSYPILRVLYVMSTGELMEMTLDCTEEPGDILCSLGYAAGSGETGCVTSEPEWLLFQDENFYAFLSRYLKTNDPGAPELQNVAHAQAINHRDWHTVIPLSDGATELLLGVIDANAVIEGGEKRSFVSEFSIELDDGRIIRGDHSLRRRLFGRGGENSGNPRCALRCVPGGVCAGKVQVTTDSLRCRKRPGRGKCSRPGRVSAGGHAARYRVATMTIQSLRFSV